MNIVFTIYLPIVVKYNLKTLVYSMNTGIFRNRSILRTLVYSETEAYSEPGAYSKTCQTSTMERFAKSVHIGFSCTLLDI